jgi:Recombinase
LELKAKLDEVDMVEMESARPSVKPILRMVLMRVAVMWASRCSMANLAHRDGSNCDQPHVRRRSALRGTNAGGDPSERTNGGFGGVFAPDTRQLRGALTSSQLPFSRRFEINIAAHDVTQRFGTGAQQSWRNVLPVIREAQKAGATTLRDIAKALNARGVATARGGQWHAKSVSNILERG